MPYNIEKSAFRAGEYVGYAGGNVFTIKRAGRGWQGFQQFGRATFTARTLAAASVVLEGF